MPVKAFIQPTGPTFSLQKKLPMINLIFTKLRQPRISWPVAVSSFPTSSPRYSIMMYNKGKRPSAFTFTPTLKQGQTANGIGSKVIVTFPAIYDKLSARPYFGQIYPRNILN